MGPRYTACAMKKLSVVIPVYNEVETIERVLGRVSAAQLPAEVELEIIVVDDASTDGTLAKLQEVAASGRHSFELVQHVENQGKGAALRSGFGAARGDFVLVQDADLEYHPRDYPVLLQPLLEEDADVVYGSRFLGGPHRVLFFWHYQGNRFLTLLSNMFTDLNLSDMETGYKVFRKEVLDKLNTALESIRHRARDDRQSRQAAGTDLRGPHLLCWSNLRRGQEDRMEGRPGRGLGHLSL